MIERPTRREFRQYIRLAPHSVMFPGIAIMLTVLASNLVGDWVRDLLDPRLKGRIHSDPSSTRSKTSAHMSTASIEPVPVFA